MGTRSCGISVLRHNECVNELNANNINSANGTKNIDTIHEPPFAPNEVTVSKNSSLEQRKIEKFIGKDYLALTGSNPPTD